MRLTLKYRQMKTILFSLTALFTLGMTQVNQKDILHDLIQENFTNESENLAEQIIQVAILLDTSSSMDGLIDQAKSRLWNIVNTLTTLRYNGKKPIIEISLYEYG